MPTAPGAVKTPLLPTVSGRNLRYNWGFGKQDDITAFKDVFQPDGGYFSPNYPLVPPDQEPVRGWNFPVGWNTVWTPRSYEPVSFWELRGLAENHDITRLAIETRKDQIEKLEWQIKPRDDENPSDDAKQRAANAHEFWERPDGEHSFSTWLRIALEDVLVIDAPSFEILRQRDGKIIGLNNVAGDTIKLLTDYKGRRPKAPAPAYEQVIHGRPWKLMSTDDFIYMPRNKRPHKMYGYSPVEQIIVTVNIGMRRQIMQLQHFTDGNVPPGLINGPEGWTPEQLSNYQAWFDSILAGNTANRTKVWWGPFGSKYTPFHESPYKDDFDEWLARVVCFAFSLPPTAFTKTQNRGEQEATKEAALEEGLAPLMGWVKRLVDYVIQVLMGQHDLEFSWKEDVRQISPIEQAQISQIFVKEGVKTRNEARDDLGLDPIEGMDELMADTAQGPVLLKNIADQHDMQMQQQQLAIQGQQQGQQQSQELHDKTMSEPPQGQSGHPWIDAHPANKVRKGGPGSGPQGGSSDDEGKHPYGVTSGTWQPGQGGNPNTGAGSRGGAAKPDGTGRPSGQEKPQTAVFNPTSQEGRDRGIAEEKAYETLGSRSTDAFSKEQTAAADRYGLNSDPFNQPLRSGQELSPKMTEAVKNLDSAIRESPLSSDITVMRGVLNTEGTFGDMKSMVGKEFSDKGYVSTTMTTEEATNFATQAGGQGDIKGGGSIMMINVPAGTGALHMGNISENYGGVGEVLLGRDSSFRITGFVPNGLSVKNGSNITTLHVIQAEHIGTRKATAIGDLHKKAKQQSQGKSDRFAWDEGDIVVTDGKKSKPSRGTNAKSSVDAATRKLVDAEAAYRLALDRAAGGRSDIGKAAKK